MVLAGDKNHTPAVNTLCDPSGINVLAWIRGCRLAPGALGSTPGYKL